MKILKSFVYLILAATIILSLSIFANAEDKDPYKYFATGDSTGNAYNSDEYIGGMRFENLYLNKRIYSNLMGDYIEKSLGREVNVTCLYPNGMRAHDLRAILDPEYVGDMYCQGRIEGWSDTYGGYDRLHNMFCEGIEEADLVTIDVCMGSLGNYLFSRIRSALGNSAEDPYETYYAPDTLESAIDDSYEYAEVVKAITSCRSSVEAKLAAAGIPYEDAKYIIDAFEYATGSLMVNLTESIKKIYELNEDVELIVMGPFNTSEFNLVLNIGKLSVSMNAFAHLYMGTIYTYLINADPNRDRFKLANMYDVNLHCYTDAIAEGDWVSYQNVTNEIRSILIKNGVAVSANDPLQDKYFKEVVSKNVEKALSRIEYTVDEDILNTVKEVINGGSSNVIATLVQAAANDYDNASELAKMALRLSFMFESWGTHPDYIGQQQKFEAVRKVYDEPYSANHTYLISARNSLNTLIETIKNGGSVAELIEKKINNSPFGIVRVHTKLAYETSKRLIDFLVECVRLFYNLPYVADINLPKS